MGQAGPACLAILQLQPEQLEELQQALNHPCSSTPSRLLKNYLRCHRGVKNRLKMLIYHS